MIRIIGGKYKGRTLESPRRSQEVRPTTSITRESVFNRFQQELPGARFLDLFAGSGVMGIEALSRGAESVLIVEKDPAHCRLIRRNYEKIGIPIAEPREHKEAPNLLLCTDVARLVARPCQSAPFDVVFADPPYGWPDLPGLVANLETNHWLTENAVLIIEHGCREPDLPGGFERKTFGISSLSSKRY